MRVTYYQRTDETRPWNAAAAFLGPEEAAVTAGPFNDLDPADVAASLRNGDALERSGNLYDHLLVADNSPHSPKTQR